MKNLLLLSAVLLQGLLGVRAANTNKFELLDGDRVAFIGDTFIEREQSYGYIETALTSRFHDRNVIFRNLGWSADTPLGESRAGFDSADKGFDRLKEQITAYKPTVVVLGYGMANSFAGEAGLAKFSGDYNKLIETIQSIGGDSKVRFLLLSPIPHERLPLPLPDPVKHNEQLAAYTQAIKVIADHRDFHFVNLFEILGDPRYGGRHALTDNGMHLTAYGYKRVAESIDIGLGWEPNVWRAGILSTGKFRDGSYGAQFADLERSDDRIHFTALPEQLPPPLLIESNGPALGLTALPMLQFQALKPVAWTLKIDGQPVKTLRQEFWQRGARLDRNTQLGQAEELRQTICRKNELFFHRWRPQNNTYLFLFRKHEQGQNAKEIPMFDPLIQAEEEKIAKLRKPSRQVFDLVPAKPDDAPTPDALSVPAAKKSTVAAPPAPAPPLPLPELKLEDGFEISLWAENPLLAKPIQMNFDAQGRLWVASSSVYPQISPGQIADDKIILLEDTDGDGRADKSSVFADGLLIPTGVEPGDGGVYVGQSTELLHLKDTDGDGRADTRRVVLSGFGTEDTHHILHTLRWGHDGQLYFNQSIYIHSHLETPHGVVRLNSGGIFNYRPPTGELDVFMKGLVNGWGHHIDDFGQSFATDGAGGAPPNGIFYVLPGGMYTTYAGARRILGSISPDNHPKYAGLEIIRSEHFPPEWQGNLITCDFRANRVVRFSVSEQGSTYVTKLMPDLITTKNNTFRPIDVKLGPDGALYIADWSNPIIQHGEVDFRDPRRDHEHGRIWRLTAKGRPALKKPALVNASNPVLLHHLLSPNGFTREKAHRVLTERGSAIAGDLAAWTKSRTNDHDRLEALWMYQSIDQIDTALLKQLLEAPDGRIRAAATRVLSYWQDRRDEPRYVITTNSPPAGQLAFYTFTTNVINTPPLVSRDAALDLLAPCIADDHPRVRLEALRALARIPTARAAELALSALDKPIDTFLDYAVWLTINDLADPWIAALESGAWKPDGREKQLAFALKSIEPARATKLLSSLVTKKSLAFDGSGGLIELIGQAGGPAELRKLLDQIAHDGFDARAAARALNALNEAARLRNARPDGDLAVVAAMLRSPNEGIRSAAARLCGHWKISGATQPLLTLAADNSLSPSVRQAAFDGLRSLGGNDAIAGLRALTAPGADDVARRSAAETLAALDLRNSITNIVAVIASVTTEDQSLALWRSLLSVKGAATAIARALPKSGLAEVAARSGLRAAREGGRSEADLILALARSGGLPDESQNLTDAEFQQIASRVKSGDPARGESVYRRKELGCVTCHAIGGAGGRVGPDMTSIGASAPVDYLVESVLAPNRKVKEGYHSTQVTTKGGDDYSGILVRETAEELILRDPTNKELSVPKKNIDGRKIGGSLMPSGLVEILTETERLDLFRFLTELGKPGPYDATRANVARVWKINTAATEPTALKSDATGADWSPLYATVSGGLPRADLLAGLEPGRKNAFYVAARFSTAKAGPVTMTLPGLNSPKAWIDGKPVGGNIELKTDLTAGAHLLIVRLDGADLPAQLRAESADVTFLVE